MGRTRKDNPLKLPERTYFKHGRFWYVHRAGNWEDLGTDLAEARRKGRIYNDPESTYGTLPWWLDQFIIYCEKRVGKPKKERGISQRTYDDYKDNVEPLKKFFAKFTPSGVKPHNVARYLEIGVENQRAVRANREKACLSASFTWLMTQPDAGVTINPCIGVKRNPESKRERYISDKEYNAVYQLAAQQVRGLMALIYRTLQRPSDILRWTKHTIIEKDDKKRLLRFRQGKTGAWIEIIISPDIDAVLSDVAKYIPSKKKPDEERKVLGMTLIHNGRAGQYTEEGIASMFRRYVKKAGLKDFGLYDIKGKGATDMWLAGVPLERIQLLCGHDSVTTTEVYVKCRWTEPVEANSVVMKSV